MTEIYIVGIGAADGYSITSVHRTSEGALKAWNQERLRLLEHRKEMKEFIAEKGYENDVEMYDRMIKNLSCEDPAKISNYPHDTPRISKWTLQE